MKNQMQDELDLLRFMEANNMIDPTEAAYFKMRTRSLLHRAQHTCRARRGTAP